MRFAKNKLTLMLSLSVALVWVVSCSQTPLPPTLEDLKNDGIPSTGPFNLGETRAYIERLVTTDDDRLKTHLLNVAIYYAHKEGRTNLKPTVSVPDNSVFSHSWRRKREGKEIEARLQRAA